LRGFQRERLAEYEEYAEHVRCGERQSTLEHHQQLLNMLDVQTKRVYRRARIMRRSILCLLAAIASLTLCSLTTGVSLLVPGLNGGARVLAVGLFLGGMGLMFIGVVLAGVELWGSLEPVQLESQFVGRLTRELESELLKDEGAVPVNGHRRDTSERD